MIHLNTFKEIELIKIYYYSRQKYPVYSVYNGHTKNKKTLKYKRKKKEKFIVQNKK